MCRGVGEEEISSTLVSSSWLKNQINRLRLTGEKSKCNDLYGESKDMRFQRRKEMRHVCHPELRKRGYGSENSKPKGSNSHQSESANVW